MSARILVVDDEPDIRFLLKDILEDEGYQVDVAEHARAAEGPSPGRAAREVGGEQAPVEGEAAVEVLEEGIERAGEPPLPELAHDAAPPRAIAATRPGRPSASR